MTLRLGEIPQRQENSGTPGNGKDDGGHGLDSSNYKDWWNRWQWSFQTALRPSLVPKRGIQHLSRGDQEECIPRLGTRAGEPK